MSDLQKSTFVAGNGTGSYVQRLESIMRGMREVAFELALSISFTHPDLAVMQMLDYWNAAQREMQDSRLYMLVGLILDFRMLICMGAMRVEGALARHPMIAHLLPLDVAHFAPGRTELYRRFRIADIEHRVRIGRRRGELVLQPRLTCLRRMMRTVEGQLNVYIAYSSAAGWGRSTMQHAFANSARSCCRRLERSLTYIGELPVTMQQIGLTFEPKVLVDHGIVPPTAVLSMRRVRRPRPGRRRACASDNEIVSKRKKRHRGTTRNVAFSDGATSDSENDEVENLPLPQSESDLLPTILSFGVREALACDVLTSYVKYLWDLPGRRWNMRDDGAFERSLATHPGIRVEAERISTSLRWHQILFRNPREIFLRPSNLFAFDVTLKLSIAAWVLATAAETMMTGSAWWIPLTMLALDGCASVCFAPRSPVFGVATALSGAAAIWRRSPETMALASVVSLLRCFPLLVPVSRIGKWIVVAQSVGSDVGALCAILGMWMVVLAIGLFVLDADATVRSIAGDLLDILGRDAVHRDDGEVARVVMLMFAISMTLVFGNMFTATWTRAASDPAVETNYRACCTELRMRFVLLAREWRLPGPLRFLQIVRQRAVFGAAMFFPGMLVVALASPIWAVLTSWVVWRIILSQMRLAWRLRHSDEALATHIFPPLRPLVWLWTSRRPSQRAAGFGIVGLVAVLSVPLTFLFPLACVAYGVCNFALSRSLPPLERGLL